MDEQRKDLCRYRLEKAKKCLASSRWNLKIIVVRYQSKDYKYFDSSFLKKQLGEGVCLGFLATMEGC